MRVKRTNPRGWRFVNRLAKLTFAQTIVRKVAAAVTAFVRPLMGRVLHQVKEDLRGLSPAKLPIREIERDDLVEGLSLEQVGTGFVVGIDEGDRGQQSGESLAELLMALEELGKVKLLTDQARSHFVDRGIYIPEGAAYLVLPPRPVLGPVFENLKSELSASAAALVTSVATVMQSQVRRA